MDSNNDMCVEKNVNGNGNGRRMMSSMNNASCCAVNKEWGWHRGFLHLNGDDSVGGVGGSVGNNNIGASSLHRSSSSTMSITIDDPSSPSHHGNTYTIPQKYNDGTHLLMANSWWSSPPSPSSPSLQTLQSQQQQPMPPGDLVELTHLHEPAIVHALQCRYERDEIYTNTGAILLALNPFKKLDHLYTREMMEMYWCGGDDEEDEEGGRASRETEEEEEEGEEKGKERGRKQEKPPHAYAVAERAFSSMLRSLEERDISSVSLSGYGNGKDDMEHAPCNQSILVSGESGAGKTVTTKIIMRYLAILSQRRMAMARNATTAAAKETSHNGDGLSVETQVLQSNPVLESFGNARTIRNDNSSRFGKFIEMSFQARKDGNSGSGGRGTLLGASIYFYLLEKVRLVSVNSGERNYHIFYEMLSCAGMDLAERRQYKLTSNFGGGRSLLSVNDFKMTCMSGTVDRRDGVDDADTYRELRMAMDTVGFSSEDQGGIFSIVSALLHASNLRFVADGGQNLGSEGCTIYDRDGTCEAVSSLLGVSEESLQMALTASAIEARGERLIKKLSVGQAEKALEALTKATYAALFAYIVKRINKSIEVHGSSDEGASGTNISGSVATIGVLDIFGFESFENNSFEQLCINYCNEALQQQFNRFVFKAEQAEYEREGIVWSNIDFPDNQEALDLIEDRRLGVFSVLDEQCRLPRCTDKTFSSAVYDKCESNSYFAASRMQKSEGRFVIVHYAGEVEYDSSGFLLKNKDELPKGASDLLASSSIPLIAELACILNNSNSTPAVSWGEGSRGSIKRSSSSITHSTVCGQFASQLRDLRSRIAGTGPHYIRCLKPNDRLIADDFDESLIAHQLNCAGVLPAMKLARAGFAMRYLHSAFIQRFRLIVSQELAQRSSTRSYHRSLNCQTLINLLSQRLESEMKRKHHPNTNAQESDDIVSWGVQIGKTKVFLRVTAFDALETLRNSTLNAAATKLQAQARSFLCQRSFFLTLGSILTLQCGARKMIATLLVRQLRFNLRSITIQKQWRSYSAWSSYQNMLFISVWCQRLWRGGKVREKFVVIKQYRSSIKIQSFWRSHVFQVCYRQQRIAAISIQCFLRVLLANKVFGQLRREAKDLQHVALERDTLRQEMQQMKRELEQVKLHNGVVGIGPDSSHDYISCSRHAEPHLSTPTHYVDSGSSSQNENSDEKIRLLHRECAKKDRELRILRKEIESLRGSGRSISSTLPSTVTVDTALPSSRSSRFSPLFSPFGFAKFHPLEDAASPRELDFQSSPNLLDTEIVDLSESECPQISNPDNSFEFNGAKGSLSSFNLASEFLLNDCDDADQLPYHRAVRNNDKAMLLNEIKKSSDIDFDVNSADSKGRTPLHIAVQCSNKELVQQLLLNNAVVNTQDFAGNTALHYAESPDLTQVLLDGGNNPNIPNGEGLCSLHLAVKRKDFMSVKCLLSHGANVNNADDEYWYTPLHLVAHADTFSTPPSTDKSTSVRGPIAELLCETTVPSIPDLNYQDRDGNTPLHHAASLVEEDAGILISLFIEHGSSPKIANNRGQTPLHLFCHNDLARRFVFYHEALHLMLACGADPNQASLSGCTALHLALYHQDIEAAALLVRHGAQLNSKWRKPMKWEVFWTDMGSEDVLPLDMLENVSMLHAVLKEISTPQIAANHRSKCMNCKEKFRVFGRHHNCMHCGRSVCGHCTPGSLNSSFFPTGRKEDDTRNGLMKVCVLCESILLSRAETGNITNNATMSVAGEEIVCDSTSIGTISM